MKKVMAAMSGGVDSSVMAYLLKEKGFDVCGVTMKLFSNEDIGICDDSRTCCTLADAEDARNVCYKLGITHYVFNFRDVFKDQVISRFVKGYQQGETPNPCIDCNKYIKFGALFLRAKMLEFDYVATGHYAIIEYDNGSKRYLLKKATDKSKDQSYVLYMATQEQLSHTLLPLGTLFKTGVREIAAECGLITANKPDSQDICFVKDGKYAKFVEDYTNNQIHEGNFLDFEDKVIGKHKGIHHYTIGQRKGLGISAAKPLYVCKKDINSNTVILGEEKNLYTKTLIAKDINLIAVEKINSPLKVKAKIRYGKNEQPAIINQISENEIFVEFEVPQKAISNGQSVVFYDDEVVIGGGIIK